MKPSHLTRNVFRAILAERPYVVRECRRAIERKPSSQRPPTTYNLQQRRHLFGINFGTTRSGFEGARSTSANVEAALGKLVDLVRARRSQSRSPPDAEIVDAFRFLFGSRAELPRRLTRNEVFLVTEAFKHLQERGHVLGAEKMSLSEQDLHNVLLALASSTGRDRFRTDARILATHVFDALRDRSGPADDFQPFVEQGQRRTQDSLLVTYITVLSKTGSAQDALELLRGLSKKSERASLPMWTAVLKGLANEGRTQEVWKVMQELQNTAGPLDAISQENLIAHFAEKDEIGAVKRIFALPLENGHVPTTPMLVKTVDCAMRNGEEEWAEKLVDSLRQRTDAGDMAGTLLVWEATHNSNVKHMEQVIQQLSDRGITDAVSMRAMNRLIQHAYTQNDPEIASRYINLAESLGLHPDGQTRAIQLDHELQSGNLTAAAQTYELMTREDIPLDRSDVPVLNRYLSLLCFSPNPDYTHLMQVVDHVLETNADLDAEAIAGLCHVFLQKDELEEATGLLRHRVDSYPLDDRARIAAVFRTFIADLSVKDQRAFNAYELFRHAFPETPVSERIPLMQSFFARQRPDLACLVFGHMRQREDVAARPTPLAYAKCFEGIAQCKDIDGLQMVYNMLKLDLEVEQTTRIHNGLMAAYTECQQPFVAIIDHFWKIMESREGPTLSSFILALRACEKWIPQGGHEARHIMALMQSFNLVITKEVYDAYVGALSGQSEFENVVELIEEMQSDIGEPPDAVTIGTFYNAIPWQYRKDEVEKWAKKAYPELWAELESYGDIIDEEWEIRYFKIDRSVDMDDELLFAEGEYQPIIAQDSQQMLNTPVGA